MVSPEQIPNFGRFVTFIQEILESAITIFYERFIQLDTIIGECVYRDMMFRTRGREKRREMKETLKQRCVFDCSENCTNDCAA